MKIFYSTNKTFQYHLHRTPPPKKKKKKIKIKIKKMKVSVYLETTKNSLEKCAKYKTYIAQVSFHILHIFAQVLYFAHFSRLIIFSKGLLVLTFYKI